MVHSQKPSSMYMSRLISPRVVAAAALIMSSVFVSIVRAEPDRFISDQENTHRIGLSNGVELVVVSTEEYRRGEVQVWLIVRAGSMYEHDGQRGAAMVLQRAIRSGTSGFSAEEIDEILVKREVGYGRLSGSFVSFDHAAYMGQVEKNDHGSIERVLSFFGEVLDYKLALPDDERVRESIAELIQEIEHEPSAEMRSRLEWLPELMQGTLFGERLSRPSTEELLRLSAQDVRDFGEAFHHPGQAMVIVVGDVDADQIQMLASETMGSVKRGERNEVVDGRIKLDVSGRAVIGTDPGFEKHQGGMIWFNDREDESTQGWSIRAGRYTSAQMRSTVIERVAGEIVRHRLSRLSTQELGVGAEVVVEQIDLFGQVDVTQIGVESEDGRWEDSLAYLVRECDRLVRDGATSDELGRARRSLLARWHRDADDWIAWENAQRMGLIHWLITTGRPIIDMVRWDRLATELMTEIHDDEINEAVRALVDPRSAAYVGLVSQIDHGFDGGIDIGESGFRQRLVLDVVDGAIATPREPIDPQWMELLAESLIDSQPDGGEIEEISQHPESGVWGALMSNGVRVWARPIESQAGRVYLCATLWGELFEKKSVSEMGILAGLSAWRMPATESRGSRAVASYMSQHGINIEARRDVGYVQLRIDAPTDSFKEAMELMFVLLDRPMIEREVFDGWQDEHASYQRDPIDEGLGLLYAEEAHSWEEAEVVELDEAQRALTQIVRNARIDIGIGGEIETHGLMDEAARLFGSLVARDLADDEGLINTDKAGVIKSERVIRVSSGSTQELGAVLGFVGLSDRELPAMRSMILASMVLSERIRVRVDAEGFNGYIRAHMGFSDVISDQMLFMIRVRCKEELLSDAYGIIDETIDEIVRDGIGEDELAGVQKQIDKSIGRYFETPAYWSQRLSTLGVHGRSVEDLWGIRGGYNGVTAEYSSQVFRELSTSNDRFRVEIVE